MDSEYIIKPSKNESVGGLKNFGTKVRLRLRKALDEIGISEIDLYLCRRIYLLNDICKTNNIAIYDFTRNRSAFKQYEEIYGHQTAQQIELLILDFERMFLKTNLPKMKKRINYIDKQERNTRLGYEGEKYVFEKEVEIVKRYQLPLWS